jgi:tRNA (cmo5U34)-methyltransferase
MVDKEIPNYWTENLSRQFMDYGRYFVPEREGQMQRIVALLGDLKQGATILELCCGEGLLAELILKTYPSYSIQAYDGSPEMLARAQSRLANFKDRFQYQIFDLASDSWRALPSPVDAVISSLAIHHLPGPQKQGLFKDIHRNLTPGGMVVIADVLEVVGSMGKTLAAVEWDKAVRQRSLGLDGNDKAFNFFISEGWNMHRYLDPEDIDKPSPIFSQLKWLEDAGFTDIDVNWLVAGHAIFSARKSGSR